MTFKIFVTQRLILKTIKFKNVEFKFLCGKELFVVREMVRRTQFRYKLFASSIKSSKIL